MKAHPVQPDVRPYRQGARAAAALETAEAIMQAFVMRLLTEWFDRITLDAVAADAGVTVQTVVRRFGSKEGLFEASLGHIDRRIRAVRQNPAGDVARAIELLGADYETTGDFIWRMLALEGRLPVVSRFLDMGRAGHREWVAATFAPQLDRLTGRVRAARIDGLVAATDLYLWKLMRRDLQRPLSAWSDMVTGMVGALLTTGTSQHPGRKK